MNLKQLEAFVSVAQYKSFSRAAEALYLTQPTVSAHVGSLEKEWNVRLFVRTTKSVELTEKGKRLYDIAKKMIGLQEELENCVRGSENKGHAPIRIAASTVPGQYLLPGILSVFGSENEESRIVLSETDSKGVVELIAQDRADIGFCGTKWPDRGLTYEPVYEDELVLVTPNREPFQTYIHDRVPLKEWLPKECFITREAGSGTRKEVEKQLEAAGIHFSSLHAGMTIENPEMIKQMIRSGGGFSVMSALAVRDMQKRGEVLCRTFSGDAVQGRGEKDGQSTASGTAGKRNLYAVYKGKLSPQANGLLKTAKEVCARAQEESADQ